MDERVYDKASLIANELTDIDDFLLSLDIQLPKSLKTRELALRLTVPVGSIIVDGTVDPFIANNEHLDKALQGPADECVEQTRNNN